MKPIIPAIERFWAKVDKNGPISLQRPELGNCWLWTAGKIFRGYGAFQVDGRQVKAHRFAWELQNGTVPADLELDHLCRTTSCVRPDHLEAVTSRVNILRGEGLAAQNARRTHCINGHEFDALTRSGKRKCLTCARSLTSNWQKLNREHLREYVKTYRAENLDACRIADREKMRRFRANNLEKMREYDRKRRRNKKEQTLHAHDD